MTSPSDLRDRVRFERRQRRPNRGGVVTTDWAKLGDPVRAKVFSLRGGETVQAARLRGQDTYEVTVRASPETLAITTDDRMIAEIHTATGVQEVALAIRSRTPDARRQWLQFLCEGGTADGA